MEFEASMDHLPEMMCFIRDQAQVYGVDERLMYKIELPCEEALVNIISYAYPNKPGKLVIDCDKKKGRIEISLRDYGIPFNPIDAEVNPQINQPIQERRIGGLGIFLIRRVIDEASYQRVGEENILRLAFQI